MLRVYVGADWPRVDEFTIQFHKRTLCWGILMYDPFQEQEYPNGMPWDQCGS